jgi:membrane protein implicated in regulation of membrane protease activity
MLFWWIAGVIFLVLELFTLSFVLVYFGIGAIVAAVAGTLGVPLWGQTAIFVVASLALLFTTRPYLLRFVQRTPYRPSNVETLSGKTGVVTIPVHNDASTGQVRIGTEFWTARTPDDLGQALPSGTRVRVLGVEGVTARVVAEETSSPSASAAG